MPRNDNCCLTMFHCCLTMFHCCLTMAHCRTTMKHTPSVFCGFLLVLRFTSIIFALSFSRRRSCKISVILNCQPFFMRCNRKTGGLAVTPHLKLDLRASVTKILQLRRSSKPLVVYHFSFITFRLSLNYA